ncbi:hypothetical protein [Dokdonella sp.]|uniref:hypothetical protein n=1 Tax=Dokdonella sp. TaxID=2291710 RepID=UPI0035282191
MTINRVTPLRRICAVRRLAGIADCLVCPSGCRRTGDHPVDPHSAQSAQADQPAGTLFGYLWIAGSAFHPLGNATTYSYPGNGCISRPAALTTGSHTRWCCPSTLVRYLRLYSLRRFDRYGNRILHQLRRAGNFVEHASVGSSNGAGGYGTSLSPLFSYEVDPFGAAINVVANLGDQNTSTLLWRSNRL